MKITDKIIKSALLLFALATLVSCSEFMLIPIAIDYPFDKDSEASPSTYSINIDSGMRAMDNIFNKEVRKVADKLVQEGATITGYPEFTSDEILELLKGERIVKTLSFEIAAENGMFISDSLDYTYSICDFVPKEGDFSTFEAGVRLDINNIADFCKKDEAEQQAEIKRCSMSLAEFEKSGYYEESSYDEFRSSCLSIEVRYDNDAIKIMMGEQKELKKYKGYLDKIYSATLNNISFTIDSQVDAEVSDAFILRAELYAQPIALFNNDGSPCTSTGDEAKQNCSYAGVDVDGKKEDYYSEDPEIKAKYFIGVFHTTSLENGQVMDLLYTYDGKDLLQKSIKHLDFQLGLKSYYIFYPQAFAPKGVLNAKIKAQLLFNVEPFN